MRRRIDNRGFGNILTTICIVILVVCIVGIAILLYKNHKTKKEYEALREQVLSESNESSEVEEASVEEPTDEDELMPEDIITDTEEVVEGPWYEDYARIPDKEVDFEELKSVNPDIYAWITIDGTAIDYPIAHCDEETAFYLDHDVNGNSSKAGMIFTDTCNSNDLSDAMTLIYGHNMKNGTMFRGLHSFRDSEFFKEHDTLKIYMDDVELDYKIYDCFVSKNEHILKMYDFSNTIGFYQYIENLEGTRDLSANFRDGMSMAVNDHVLTLITCVGDTSKRLFVQCVLTYPDGTTGCDHLDDTVEMSELVIE